MPPLLHLVGPAPPLGPLPPTDIPVRPGQCARATRARPRPNPPSAWPGSGSPTHLPALWGLLGSAVAETHNQDKGAAPRGLTQPSRPGCAAFGEFNELSITPFRARPSAWINLRSPGGVGDTKPVFITLPLSLIEVIICDSGLANNAAFTPGTSMGLAPTLGTNPPSLPLQNAPRAKMGPGACWENGQCSIMFHLQVVSPKATVELCFRETPDSPKVGEKRKQAGLSHRALELQPGWHAFFLGRWHQGAPVVNRTLEYWEAYYSLLGVLRRGFGSYQN